MVSDEDGGMTTTMTMLLLLLPLMMVIIVSITTMIKKRVFRTDWYPLSPNILQSLHLQSGILVNLYFYLVI